MKSTKLFHSFFSSSDPIPALMDKLNLQSNSASNFVLNGSTVSQWTDLSPSANHATQGTGSLQPLYNSGAITFDGSGDFLSLGTEFFTNVYSAYFVIKTDASQINVTRPFFGAATNNHYFSAGTGRNLYVSNLVSGGTVRYNFWGDEYYQVVSVRRNGATWLVSCNGRLLDYSSGTQNTADHYFKYVGKSSGGSSFMGIIRSVCISSSYLSDAEDLSVINTLFTRYNLPETSTAIVGWGDSLTVGTGASNALTTAWLPTLGTSLSRNIKNLGKSGTQLTVRGLLTDYLIERPYSDTICILYGTNDSPSVTASAYDTAMRTLVADLISAGYSANRICLGTTPYQIGDANGALLQQYHAKCAQIVTDYSLKPLADCYTPMKAYGDGCMSDTKHPNDIGHSIIASAFQTALA